MKPKYRRIAKFLPAIISISMATTSSAALFLVDTAGNGEPAAVNNGTTTIIADGGAGPQDPTPTLTIGSDINMTGDAGEGAVIVVSGPNAYTINIAAGAVLNAGDPPDDGINIDNGGATTTTIKNSGSITGAQDGINFAGDGGTVNNLAGGIILGIDDNGIGAGNNLTVVNDGSISSTNDDAISALDGVTITNNAGGTISGGEDGVDINNDGTIHNYGSITGTDDGVQVVNDGSVTNYTNFDPLSPFGPISGGTITGDSDGITADNNLTVVNQNLGTISGTNGDGISANDGATITNNTGGTITGGDDGIDVGNDAFITNQFGATITSLGDNGVQAGDRADITNAGTITGVNNGVYVEDDSVVTNSGSITGDTGVEAFTFGPFTLNNSGTVTSTNAGFGGEAIDGALGNDLINLNPGSVINGDIVLKGGDDDIFMTSDAFASNVVNGNINGGFGFDTLNFDGGMTSPFSTTNIVHGDVTFMQDIIKNGVGTAFIGAGAPGGDPLFFVQTDEININGGGLYINADIDSAIVPQTTINAGGTALGGTGTWDADIFVTAGGFSAGAIPINLDLDPTNAVGDLAVNGNVTHSPGTFIRHDVTPNGADDLITHTSGTYDLGADTGIRVSATNNDTVIRNGVYTVVDSDIPIAGSLPSMAVQFNDNVNTNDSGLVGSRTWNTGVADTDAVLNSFMYSNFDDGGTNLVFIVDHDFEGLPGLSSNASSLGAALDDSIDNPNAQIQDFIAALDYSDLETVQETMESLIPDNVLGAATAIVGSNYRLHRIVEDHLAMTRSGGTTIIETPATTDAKGGMIPAQMTSSDGGMGNVWGTFSYDWRDSDFGTTDIEGEDASFTVGIDYRVAPNLLLGILFDGTQSDYDYSGGSTDTDSYRFAAYGTYGESTGLYADFLVGYGDHDLDNSRSLGGILAGTSYDTSTDAESLQALLNVGYAMQSGCVKHGPFVGLEYTNIDVDSFAPSGLGGFGSVDGFEVDSLRLLVGYRAEATYGSFTPFGQVAYAHEFDDGPVSATATIPGGATFKFNGGGVESAVLVTLGTGYSITENLSATIAYHSEFSTGDGIDSQGGSIGLNYGF